MSAGEQLSFFVLGVNINPVISFKCRIIQNDHSKWSWTSIKVSAELCPCCPRLCYYKVHQKHTQKEVIKMKRGTSDIRTQLTNQYREAAHCCLIRGYVRRRRLADNLHLRLTPSSWPALCVCDQSSAQCFMWLTLSTCKHYFGCLHKKKPQL